MQDRSLGNFRDSLIKAAKLAGMDVENITRPIYLSTCKAHNIEGWTKEQILEHTKGWKHLKKIALSSYKQPKCDIEDVVNLPIISNYMPIATVEDDLHRQYYVGNAQKDLYLAEYARFIKLNNYVPTFSVFKEWYGDKIDRDVYKNIQEIDDDYRCYYKEEAEQYLFDKKSWTEEYRKAFYEEVAKHRKFILVSVGSFCTVDFKFLSALRLYAKQNNAMIIGLPLFKRYNKSVSDFCVHPDIRNYMWITFEDVLFNLNLMAQVIKASCTVKSTLTGLNQIVSKYDSSIIVAGINQQLKYIPVLKDKTPNMIASTGCCTEYEPVRKDENIKIPTKAEKLAQERLSIKGALIVELGEEETFTVRNIEAATDGSFIDLAVQYNPDETMQFVFDSTFVIGDLHAPKHNEVLLSANLDIVDKCRCTQVVLHDSVNMGYISHHNADQAITRAKMVEEGKANILDEIKTFADILRKIINVKGVEKVVIPYSNHPAHFDRFIQDIGRMSKDDINLRTSLKTALAMLDNKNTLQYLVEELVGFRDSKIHWINEDDGMEVHGVQVGLHGSEKVNGGRMTTTSTNNAFFKTVLAHRHTAGIDGDTITVGISCEKDQGYNHGLSSWTESSAIVYPNGKVQLLTFVNVKGEYKLWL